MVTQGGAFPVGMLFVNERRPERSLSLFLEKKKSGRKALFISRHKPQAMAGEEDMRGVECHRILLREEPNSIQPSNLEKIESIIREFFEKNKGGVALIDGVEMLTLFNDFDKVTDLLRKAQDAADSYGGFIIIPIDNRSIYPEDFKAICEKFEFLDSEGID